MDSFPAEQLLEFLPRMNKAVKGAAKNSRRLTQPSNYDQLRKWLIENTSACGVYFYGSRIIGVGHKLKSDLDIFIAMKSFNEMSREGVIEMVKRLKSVITSDKIWRLKIALYDCTVPVLRCYCIPERLNCKLLNRFS